MRRAIMLAATLFVVVSAFADDRTASCSCGTPSPMPTPWVIRHPSTQFQTAAAYSFSLWNLYISNVTQASFNGTGQISEAQVLDGTRDLGFFDFQAADPSIPDTLLGLTPSAPKGSFGDFNQCPPSPSATCGVLTDADVLISAKLLTQGLWSTDPPEVSDDNPTVSYVATAAHEIGHSLGMHHNFHNISIMNYYQDYAGQYLARADVLEARSHFPGQVIQLTDLAAYPFRYDQNKQPQTPNDGSVDTSRGEPAVSIVSATPQVVPGGPMQIKDWTIENLSTAPVSNVRMRFYLSTNRTITSSDYYVGGLVFSTLNTWSDSSFACGAVNNDCTFTVPSNIPLGSYYLGGLIVYGDSSNPTADPITYNNSWSLPTPILVVSSTGPSANELSLLSGRFAVSLRAVDPRTGHTGTGLPIPEPGNTLFGYFAIPDLTGNPNNPEVFVKILDARTVNGKFWLFYGGLTDLQLTLVVRDTQTGAVKQYQRAGGSLCGDADVSAFGVGGEVSAVEVPVFTVDAAVKTSMMPSLLSRVPAPAATCGVDALCLLSGRFGVVLAAADPRTGNVAPGVALVKNDLFGYFSIPGLTSNPSNPEVFVKMLDGRSVNGKYWVFIGGLTDFELLVRVIDGQTGLSKDFHRDGGSFCGLADVSAF